MPNDDTPSGLWDVVFVLLTALVCVGLLYELWPVIDMWLAPLPINSCADC